MPATEASRGLATRCVTQLSFFDQPPPRVSAPPDPPPDTRQAAPATPTAPPGRLPDDASLWAISFAGDARGPQDRVAEASARYRDRFGRAHTLVAVPLAELDTYRAAGVAALGDGRLARSCVYLLHPPDDQALESEGTT
jgi:hypothetical protein